MTKVAPNGRNTASFAYVADQDKKDINASLTQVVEQSKIWVCTTLHRFEQLISGRYVAQYGIAVTRILLGIAGLGVLLTNFNARFYVFGQGQAWSGELENPRSDFPNIGLFSLFHQVSTIPWLFTLLYISVAVLALTVILGWRTRVILPVYIVGYVSLIELNDAAGDQGDNAYRIMLLAMIFTNSTLRWSMDARRRARQGIAALPDYGRWDWVAHTAHNLALIVMAFQVCAVYMAGGLYKAAGESWQHGYAVYDPLQTAQFGTWPVLSELLTTWGPAVVIMSWGSVIVQIAFPFLLLNAHTRRLGLVAILSFHLGIALLMGLPWFSLTMIAIDAIFVRDTTYLKVSTYLTKKINGLHLVSTRKKSI